MKNNKGLLITLITLLSVIVILLITLLIVALSKNIKLPNNFNFDVSSNKHLIYEKTYEIDKISNIEITSSSSDIYFKESNNDTLTIDVYSSHKNKVEEININDTVGINYSGISNCFGFCYSGQNSITVTLPKSYSKNLNLSSKSGDIKLINLDKASLDLSSASGDLSIKNVDILKASTISGDIRIDKVTNKLNAKTVSGDININKLNLKGNSLLETTSGDVNIDNINDVYVSAKTVSGDTIISDNNRFSKTELSIKTVSGDITVR